LKVGQGKSVVNSISLKKEKLLFIMLNWLNVTVLQ
jgi:hypothetical protein